MQTEDYQPESYDSTPIIFPEASNGLRFANMLIDYLMIFAVTFIVTLILGVISAFMQIPFMNFIGGEDITSKLLHYTYSYICYVLIYTLSEGIFKGRTLGKLITGTKAITEDGNTITWKDAFMRSLCRIIPFEAFSAFGNQLWHDRLTKTKVVVIR